MRGAARARALPAAAPPRAAPLPPSPGAGGDGGAGGQETPARSATRHPPRTGEAAGAAIFPPEAVPGGAAGGRRRDPGSGPPWCRGRASRRAGPPGPLPHCGLTEQRRPPRPRAVSGQRPGELCPPRRSALPRISLRVRSAGDGRAGRGQHGPGGAPGCALGWGNRDPFREPGRSAGGRGQQQPVGAGSAGPRPQPVRGRCGTGCARSLGSKTRKSSRRVNGVFLEGFYCWAFAGCFSRVVFTLNFSLCRCSKLLRSFVHSLNRCVLAKLCCTRFLCGR